LQAQHVKDFMPSSDAERDLCARFRQAVPDRVNADAHLVWRGRSLRADCLVQIGATAFLLRIDAGRISECLTSLPLLCPWEFAVRGSAAAWSAFWRDPPPPGWHDLFALSKRGEMSFEGNLQPFLAHLQYVKDVLALPRAGGAR
jgi:hypothetical protein